MTNDECRQQLYSLKYAAGGSQRYHHRLEWWYGFADKCLRIVIGVIAAFELVVASSHDSFGQHAIAIAGASFFAALLLNVIPLGDREKFYGEMFRRWTELYKDVELLTSRLDLCPTTDAPEHICERLLEMKAKEHELNAAEPAPFRWLQKKCEADEIESQWGPGIRTHAATEVERAKRLKALELAAPKEAGAAGPGQE